MSRRSSVSRMPENGTYGLKGGWGNGLALRAPRPRLPMSTAVLADGTEVRVSAPTAKPLLLGTLASLSVGAAAIHFAVTFEHFTEYTLYGAFFLVVAWAQLVWPAVLIALPSLSWAPAGDRPARLRAGWSRSGLTPLAARRLGVWLWLGVAGNAAVLAVYFASRSIGLPIGPDTKSVEAWGGLDLVCAIQEILLVAVAAAVLARPRPLACPVSVPQPGAVAGQHARSARRCNCRHHGGHDTRVGGLGGPGWHGLQLVGRPAGRHG